MKFFVATITGVTIGTIVKISL